MIIEKIEINNFRGFFKKKTISFKNKNFVLLSAANGVGKTSTIDAIEWCLTGDIRRLKLAYDHRSPNAQERKINSAGILKNKFAEKDEKVKVELWFNDNDEEYHLVRTQIKDELDPELSNVTLNDNKFFAQEWLLKNNIGDSFYKYHFCDVQKTFEIQTKDRGKLVELFSDFISDYSKEKNLANNLELFIDDIDRYKEDLKEKIIDQKTIDQYEISAQKYKKLSSIVEYPKKIIFEGENLNAEKMTSIELENNLKLLYSYGNTVAYGFVNKIVNNSSFKDALSLIDDLKVQKEENGVQIQEAIRLNFDKDNKVEDENNRKIIQYQAKKLTRDNISKHVEDIINLDDSRFTRDIYSRSINEIQAIKEQRDELEKDIDHLVHGNRILGMMKKFISEKDSLLLFKKDHSKCPICGSSDFEKITDEEILFETKKYLEDSDKTIIEKENNRNNLNKEIDDKYNELLNLAKQVLRDSLKNWKELKVSYEEIREKSSVYFDIKNRIVRLIGKKYQLEGKLDLEGCIDDLRKDIESKILKEEDIKKYREEYEKILALTGEDYERGSEKEIEVRLKGKIKRDFNTELYDFGVLREKINSIKSYLNNQNYIEEIEKYRQACKNNKEIRDSLIEYDKIIDKAQERADNIKTIVSELEVQEFKLVGPSLKKYFKKLVRIDTLNEIEVILDSNKITMSDDNGNNIVNILSNGQLSAFMLAYFFAGISTREKSETCKVYFMDDLTACMDDINMLSLLDLLKYQMLSEKKTMEQIFFVTCDERISSLLRYKLTGCGIDFCELTEEDFTS